MNQTYSPNQTYGPDHNKEPFGSGKIIFKYIGFHTIEHRDVTINM